MFTRVSYLLLGVKPRVCAPLGGLLLVQTHLHTHLLAFPLSKISFPSSRSRFQQIISCISRQILVLLIPYFYECHFPTFTLGTSSISFSFSSKSGKPQAVGVTLVTLGRLNTPSRFYRISDGTREVFLKKIYKSSLVYQRISGSPV